MTSKPEQLVGQIREMALFRRVGGLLLDSGADLKAAMWTKEILTFNLNTLIDKFLSSDKEHIDDFLKTHLDATFPDSHRRKQLYCFNLLMSLNTFAPKCPYLRLYQRLLSTETEYPHYNFFWELKAEVLALKLDKDNFYADLDKLFLDRKKWQVLLKRSLCFDHKQVLEFEAAVTEKVLRMKRERTIKYVSDLVRNEEYCATFFIQEVLERFTSLYRADKERTNDGASGEPGEPENPSYQDMLRRATQNRASRAAVPTTSIPTAEVFRAKQVEKERLKTELRNTVATANRYKNSAAKLVSYIQVIDPIVEEAKQVLHRQRQAFLASRRQFAKGENLEAFQSATTQPMSNFLEQGSSLFATNSSTIKRKLLGLSVDSYSKVEERALDFMVAVRALAARLRKIIFDEKFRLAASADNNDIEEVRQEIDKLFSHYRSLNASQVVILDTFFNNVAELGEEATPGNTVLENVSKKLLAAVQKGLDTNLEGLDLDSAIRKDYETFRGVSSRGDQTEPSSNSRVIFGTKRSVFQPKKLTSDMASGNDYDDYQSGGAYQTAGFGSSSKDQNRIGARISFAHDIQPMKGAFHKRGFLVNRNNGSSSPKPEVNSSNFYDMQRNKSTQGRDEAAVEKLSASAVKESRASGSARVSETQQKTGSARLSDTPQKQNSSGPAFKGSIDGGNSAAFSARQSAKGSTPGQVPTEQMDLYERALQESMARGARPSTKLEHPSNLPDPTLLPAFSSFSMNQDDHRKLMEARNDSQPRGTLPDVTDKVRPSSTSVPGASGKGDSIVSQEIENRYSTIGKGFQPDLDVPDVNPDFSSDQPDPDAFHKKPASQSNRDLNGSAAGFHEEGEQQPDPEEGEQGNPNDPAFFDRLKEKEVLNSKHGQKMAQAIGLGTPGEKKVAKNFWGDVFFPKK